MQPSHWDSRLPQNMPDSLSRILNHHESGLSVAASGSLSRPHGSPVPFTQPLDSVDAISIPDSSRKRHRVGSSRSTMSYPRKRAVTACQLCRARKRKCNNGRPKCKFCEEIGVECNYQETGDHSSFDPASLVIIEHLNQIIDRLDNFSPTYATFCNSQISGGCVPSPRNTDARVPEEEANSDQHQANVEGHDDFQVMPSSRTSPDTILTWPIFHSKYHSDYLVDALFPSEVSDSDDEYTSEDFQCLGKRKVVTGNFREEEIYALIENFLNHVHTKNPILDNPILDVGRFRGYVRTVIEEGPGWDGPSCVVLLACALGALAGPFDYRAIQAHYSNSITKFESELQLSESYYALARRRIGLLSASIVRSQCYFWSGVYLMYTLRPLEAWQNFLQASSAHHIHLKGRLRQASEQKPCKSLTRLLEQRLYWSCFKSECELRIELNLPASSIANLKYPDMFPSPPESRASELPAASPLFPSCVKTSSPSTMTSTSNQDQSWYYYLSEIALRRIANNVLRTFYAHDQYPGYGMSIELMVKIATNFLDQMSHWYESLPCAIRYDKDDFHDRPCDELTYMTRNRAFEIYGWLYRPFLYYAIHHRSDDPYRATVEPFILDALNTACSVVKEQRNCHRHHGAWYGIRSGTASAITLLAARKCGHINHPPEWVEVVKMQIVILDFWEAESPDSAKAKVVLNTMLGELETP